ncbi:ecdysone-induced protein 74EF [Calliphora vicina]|uniref:ecdysone-induced protein 74EF n=1 Tax=Calliphora vicina TaxID=7373 RepID=UPI00325B14C9
MNYQKGIKDPNLERHSNKGKSRHFPVNGLGSVNSAANNDTRNIYNNPYTSSSLQQQQQQQQLRHQQLHQQQQQLPQHVYKSIAGSSIGGNSNQYDYSTPNLTTDQQASSAAVVAAGLVAGVSSNNTTEAENLFLNHNNGKLGII